MQHDDVTAFLSDRLPSAFRSGRGYKRMLSGKHLRRHNRRHQHGARHPAPTIQRQGARPQEKPLVVRLPRPNLFMQIKQEKHLDTKKKCQMFSFLRKSDLILHCFK